MSTQKNNTQFIVCPLCDKKISYKRIEKAHIWICSYCSFIGFEFWGKEDRITINNYLKNKK